MAQTISATEFWAWAYGDFLSNAQRGVLAEYIVATALGCTHRPRVEWDAFDLQTDDGIKVEVKSAAYLQSWEQKGYSVIRFDIAPKQGWDSSTNTNAVEALRSADVYVFCVFATKEKESANPLELTQWFFLVCSTEILNEKFGAQKSVGLSQLEAIGLSRVSYVELAAHIRAAVM